MAYDVFISYKREDGVEAAWLASQLSSAGISCFLDLDGMTPGRQWRAQVSEMLPALKAVVVCIGQHGLGNQQRWEIQQAIAASRGPAPNLAIITARFSTFSSEALGELSLYTWIDLLGRRQDGLRELIVTIKGGDLDAMRQQARAARASRPPYRGLQTFREDDAPYFFGRETISDSIARLVDSRRFVAVTGASGSGKSSIVQAGVIPRLRAGTSGRIWSVITMRPGSDPLQAVAEQLAPYLNPGMSRVDLLGQERKLREELAEASPAARLSRLIEAAITSQGSAVEAVLLVVDQFEEVFTLTRDPATRDTFIKELVSASQSGGLPIHVLITLREDHERYIEALPDLRDAIRGGRVHVDPMSRDDMRRAIELPLAQAGLRFEDAGLVDLILRDVERREGALPLLQFLLEKLWQDRNKELGLLTHEAYRRTEGAQAAIATHAERIFKDLPPAEQAQAEALFLTLVQPGDSVAGDVRRPIAIDDLSESRRKLAEHLAGSRSRLLVVSGPNIELVHEALLTAWGRLKDWIAASRGKLRQRSLLEQQARLWRSEADRELPNAASRLLPEGAQLSEAEALLQKDGGLLDGLPDVRDFIIMSSQAAQRERSAKAEAARAAQVARQRLKSRVGMAAVVLIAALGFGGLALMGGVERWRDDARQGRLYAVRASNDMVNQVSRSLSETEGVPPSAIVTVLANARRIVNGVADKLVGDALELSRLTTVDVLINSAATELVRGNGAQFKTEIEEARTQLSAVCSSERKGVADCALRTAEIELLSARHQLNKQPTQPQRAIELAQQTIQRLDSINDGGKEDATLTRALLSLEARTTLARAAILSFGLAKSEERSQQALQAILPVLQVCDADAASNAAERPRIEMARVSCLAARAEVQRLLANRSAATKDAAGAEALLGKIPGAGAAGIPARIAKTEIALVSGLIEADGRSADAKAAVPVRATDGNLPTVPTVPTKVVEGLRGLAELARSNKDNFLIRNRYLQLTRLLISDTLKSAMAASDAAQIEIYRTRIDYIADRLRGVVDAEEVRPLLAGLLTGTRWLYVAYDRNGNYGHIINHYKGLQSLLAEHNALVLDPDGNDEDYLVILYEVGEAYRRERKEDLAVAVNLKINDIVAPRIAKQPCKEQKAKERRVELDCFFQGSVVKFLSEINVSRYDDPAKIDDDLKAAQVIIEKALAISPDNFEFRQSLAKIAWRQGQRLEAKGAVQDALRQYQQAAERGSIDAIKRIRDWVNQNQRRGTAGNIGLVDYEQRQRDLAPVAVEVRAKSSILGGPEPSTYTVFLAPPQAAGSDPVAREVNRLRDFYGATIEPDSEARLRDIISRAAANAGRSAYTHRHLVRAQQQRAAADREDKPFGTQMIEDALKTADYARTNNDVTRMLEALDGAATKLQNSPEARRNTVGKYDWGVLGYQYLRLAAAAADVNNAMVKQRADQKSQEAFRRAFERAQPANRAEAHQLGRKYRDLADRMFDYFNTNKNTSFMANELSDKLSYSERFVDVILQACDLAVDYYEFTAPDGPAVFDENAERAIIAIEHRIGATALLDKKDRLQRGNISVIEAGIDPRRRAIKAYTRALGRLSRFPKAQRGEWELGRLELGLLIGLADAHLQLGEPQTAQYVAYEAFDLSKKYTQSDHSDTDRRQMAAATLETLADCWQELARSKLLSAVGISVSSKDSSNELSKRLLEMGGDEFRKAIESRRDAILNWVEVLRVDIESDAANMIRLNVDKVVGMIQIRRDMSGADSQYALKEARAFAKQILQGLVPANAAVDSRNFLNVETAKGMTGFNEQLKSDLRFISAQQTQTGADQQEIDAVVRFVATLAYEVVAEFNIRAAASSAGSDQVQESIALYEAIAEEMRQPADLRPREIAEYYALTLSNLAYARLLERRKDFRVRREDARKSIESAKRIADSYRMYDKNITANYAHIQFLSDSTSDVEAARATYRNLARTRTSWRGERENACKDWATQVVRDLEELQRVSPPEMTQRFIATIAEIKQVFREVGSGCPKT